MRPLPVLREAFAMVGQRWKKVRYTYYGYTYLLWLYLLWLYLLWL